MPKPKTMKKVLIMTVGFGGGHNAVAKTIEQILGQMTIPTQVRVVDVMSEAHPAFSRQAVKAYSSSTGTAGGFWFDLYYRISDRFPALLSVPVKLFFQPYGSKLLQQENPDLIVALYPFTADTAAIGRDNFKSRAPIVQLITDAGHVQGIWLNKRADLTLTATPDTVDYLIQRGMKKNRVAYIGFPVGEKFYKPYDSVASRAKTGLDADKFTILVTSGGMGLSPRATVNFVRDLAHTIERPYQVILNAGHNNALKTELENIKFPRCVKVIVNGYVDNMIDFMRASDLICTKSGWLTISEALALEKPLLLYDALPGHEMQNVRYVMERGYGVYRPKPYAAALFARRARDDGDLLKKYQDAMIRDKTNLSPHPAFRRLFEKLIDRS